MKTLETLIAENEAAYACNLSLATVTPAASGFGMYQLGEIESYITLDLREALSMVDDADEVVLAEDVDGRVYGQGDMQVFRAPSGELMAIAITGYDKSEIVEFDRDYVNEMDSNNAFAEPGDREAWLAAMRHEGYRLASAYELDAFDAAAQRAFEAVVGAFDGDEVEA